jgi:hypothetical protein
MAEKTPQTRGNHTRIDPSFHYVLLPVLLFIVIWAALHAARHAGTEAIVLLLLAAMALLSALKTRQYAAKVQDRVIRLEERLRLAALLPAEAPDLSAKLTERQFVALRFASDAEFPALAQRAARENLSGQQIKDAIQNWRPDYWRI